MFQHTMIHGKRIAHLKSIPSATCGHVVCIREWASGGPSSPSVIVTSDTFASQLVRDRRVPRGWRLYVERLPAGFRVVVRVPLGFQVNVLDLSQGGTLSELPPP